MLKKVGRLPSPFCWKSIVEGLSQCKTSLWRTQRYSLDSSIKKTAAFVKHHNLNSTSTTTTVKFRHGHMHWNTMLDGSHHLPSQVLLHILAGFTQWFPKGRNGPPWDHLNQKVILNLRKSIELSIKSLAWFSGPAFCCSGPQPFNENKLGVYSWQKFDGKQKLEIQAFTQKTGEHAGYYRNQTYTTRCISRTRTQITQTEVFSRQTLTQYAC